MIGARLLGTLLSPAGKGARLSILIYHRVLPVSDPLFPQEVDALRFEEQMRIVSTHFNVLPLDEAVTRLQGGTLPARAACITFDDGYADNAEIALPILKRCGLCAAFFIATDYLDGGRMWNDDVIEAVRGAADVVLDLSSLKLGQLPLGDVVEKRVAILAIITSIKYLPEQERAEKAARIAEIAKAAMPTHLMMTTPQVRALHDAGMLIGGHTGSHPILARLQLDDAEQEIRRGKETLENIIGEQVKIFAYPNGKPHEDYKSEHADMVRKLGFQAAVSTALGVGTCHTDPFQLPRFTPWDYSSNRFLLRLLNNLRYASSDQV